MVLLGGDESQLKNGQDQPLVFDWVALREIRQYVESTAESPRKCARLIVSDRARARIGDDNLELLSTLEQRGVIEVHRIRSEEFTGGRYRNQQMQASDAMLAIGGGKGTYISGSDMTAIGKPVLPLDFEIGALSEDGDGGLLLHKELMQDTSRFFPCTHDILNDRLDTLTLRIHPTSVVAQRAAELLSNEMEACGATQHGKASFFEPIKRLARKLTWSEWVRWGERIFDIFRWS